MQPTPAAPEQQPSYPPASTGYPVQQAPKKRSRWPLILAALGVFGLLCCGGAAIFALAGGDDNNASSSAGGAGNGAAKAKATLGVPVRDGKFEFVVTDAKCGQPTLGAAPLNKPAQGQFCLVTVKVKNIGKEPQTFSDSSQKAFGNTGVQYSTDTAAGLYANQNADVFLNEINPGNEITGVLVFDIPKDAKLAKLELHDSPFSGGVEVTLG